MKPGEPLREQALAAEFGISRGPIRDAFVALSKEGLLIAKPNAGVKVAPAASAFKRSVIVQLRRDIESSALATWFDNRDGNLLESLGENLSKYEEACRAQDMDTVVDLDLEFHRLIVKAADGGSLVELWTPIVLQMFLRYSRHHSLMESFNEHKAIYDAIANDQGAKAVELIRRHIQ